MTKVFRFRNIRTGEFYAVQARDLTMAQLSLREQTGIPIMNSFIRLENVYEKEKEK